MVSIYPSPSTMLDEAGRIRALKASVAHTRAKHHNHHDRYRPNPQHCRKHRSRNHMFADPPQLVFPPESRQNGPLVPQTPAHSPLPVNAQAGLSLPSQPQFHTQGVLQ